MHTVSDGRHIERNATTVYIHSRYQKPGSRQVPVSFNWETRLVPSGIELLLVFKFVLTN